jgi:adenosylcobinamide amidohydrolase
MLDGVAVTVDTEAVVVTAERPLAVVSSAVVGGGVGCARSIVNLHVPLDFQWQDAERRVGTYARDRALPEPWVGLLTAAWTEKAQLASESVAGIAALVITTVGLGNLAAAGLTRAAAPTPAPSTINTIVVVDADPEPAALVNLVMTVTEVKTAALAAAGVRCADGPATGTSTDAVVVAATGVGARGRFGGPISALGAVVARAARNALSTGITRWIEEHR